MNINYTDFLTTRESSFSKSVWVDRKAERIYFCTPSGHVLGYEAPARHGASLFAASLDVLVDISVNQRGSGLGVYYNRDVKNLWTPILHEYEHDVTFVFEPFDNVTFELDSADAPVEEVAQPVNASASPTLVRVAVTLEAFIAPGIDSLVESLTELSDNLAGTGWDNTTVQEVKIN